MDHDRMNQVQDLFHEALELNSMDRGALLERHEPKIADEVVRLLAAYEKRSSFLDPTDVELENSISEPLSIGVRLGPYKILRKLGEGGMGVVYLARQEEPIRRHVAIKVIKTGANTETVVARFEYEQQALASMNHSAIAQVYEAGAMDRDHPYFVMEHVDGLFITEYCNQHRLAVRERIELFVQVCAGVEHAHQNTILHRDLKPSNILVAKQDGRPVPKIIDFGVAKATRAESAVPENEGLIGTPEYMSPEQITASRTSIDTRADVYALGVLLYELLTGATPFGPVDSGRLCFDELRNKIEVEVPTKPSERVLDSRRDIASIARQRRTYPARLSKALQNDLNWIVLKALEKDRDNRYQGAKSFADDLRRYFRHDAVVAAPDTWRYRSAKFLRRHRALVTSSGLLILALTVGIVGTTTGLVRAKTAETIAAAEADTARNVLDLMVSLFKVADPREGVGKSITVQDALALGERELAGRLSEEPSVKATLLDTIGVVYRQLGLYEQAESVLVEALDLRTERAAVDPLGRAISLQHVAELFLETGRYDEAAKHLHEALSIQREKQASRKVIATTLKSLGSIHHLRGETALADARLREALTIRVDEFGSDSLEVAENYNDLGNVLFSGHPSEALMFLEKAHEIFVKKLGEDHANTVSVLGNLAAIYTVQGDLEPARTALATVLRVKEEQLGPTHASLATTLHTLASVESVAGNYLEAKALLEHAMAILMPALGPDHPNVGAAHIVWARIFFGLNNLPEAERHYQRAVEILQSKIPDTHPLFLTIRTDRARLLMAQGRLAEAEESYLEADGPNEELLRSTPNNADGIARKALIQLGLGEVAELRENGKGESSFLAALSTIKPLTQADQSAVYREIHARILLHLGQDEEARPLVEALLENGWRNRVFDELAAAHGITTSGS